MGKVGLYIYHSSCIQSSHKQSFLFTCFVSHRLNEDEVKAKVWYELNNPTFIRQYRPGESKRSRRARAERKEREEIRRHREEVREQARLAAASKKNSSSFSSSPPSRSYRLGKHNKKYVVIRNPAKSTPRTHNHRRKVLISKHNLSNYNKNKAPSHGRKTSLNQPTNSNTRRSLKFKRHLYRKMYQNKKVVRPAPMVTYKESRREEIRFTDDDDDWNFLNEAIAIAKQEAVELELRAIKEREDEEETAPSDTIKLYDPVKAALDFLVVNGIAAGTSSVRHVEQIQSQRYTRRPVHPATSLMTEELRFYRLCHVVAVLGASNTKSGRRIKKMLHRMMFGIKTFRLRHNIIAVASVYTAKLEYMLDAMANKQRSLSEGK